MRRTPPETAARTALQLVLSLPRWFSATVEGLAPEISFRQLQILQAIEDRRTLGFLSRHLGVTPAVITGLADRLERRGAVRRVPNTDDRRAIHLELTEAGAAMRDRLTEQVLEHLLLRLESLGDADVRRIQDALALLDRVLSRYEEERAEM